MFTQTIRVRATNRERFLVFFFWSNAGFDVCVVFRVSEL